MSVRERAATDRSASRGRERRLPGKGSFVHLVGEEGSNDGQYDAFEDAARPDVADMRSTCI